LEWRLGYHQVFKDGGIGSSSEDIFGGVVEILGKGDGVGVKYVWRKVSISEPAATSAYPGVINSFISQIVGSILEGRGVVVLGIKV